jgi:hypothetical protein
MKLNKQLIEKVAKGDVAIDNTGNPNLELLRAVLKEAFPQDKDISHGKAHFFQTVEGKYWSGHYKTSLPTIPLLDFLEKEEAFPLDDFGVLVENSNGKEIVDYLVSKGFKNPSNYVGNVVNSAYYFIESKYNFIKCNFKNPTSKTYTLQQLKQLDMQDKEIIGYKLIKPEYENAAIKIVAMDLPLTVDRIKPKTSENNSTLMYDRLKKAGVLELWFKPVYKETKKLPKINGYEGKVENEFVVYGNNCAKFHKQFFKNLSTVNEGNNWGNRKVKSIKLDSGVEITIEQVKQIVDFLN